MNDQKGTNGTPSKELQQLKPVDRLKIVINSDGVQEQFKNALAENSGLFVASLIDVYATNPALQRCNPGAVVMEALKAATLKLVLNKNLGFACIVPHKNVPSMQIGYKGYIQLAIRTGQYRRINADIVCDGELKKADKLTGEVDLSGTAKSDEVIGYFAHYETLNGFRKTLYWSKERVKAHAKKFSKSYSGPGSSPWKSDFDAMGIKTVIKALLSKYGIMSVEMIAALDADTGDFAAEIKAEANKEMIDMSTGEVLEEEKEEIPEEQLTREEMEEIEAGEATQGPGPIPEGEPAFQFIDPGF